MNGATAVNSKLEHVLSLSPIDYATASKARRKLIDDGAQLCAGACSCGEWAIPLGDDETIRSVHAVHVEDRSGGVDEETGLRELLNAKVAIGLRQQGHLQTVTTMVVAGSSWEEIGATIGWHGPTVRDWYAREVAAELLRTSAVLVHAEELGDWVENLGYCPCCESTLECSPGCTFADDCPAEHRRMAEARDVLAAYRVGVGVATEPRGGAK